MECKIVPYFFKYFYNCKYLEIAKQFFRENLMGQTIGMTRDHHLVNLQGQVLAEVRDGKVYRGGGAHLLEVRGGEILNASGQPIASVDGVMTRSALCSEPHFSCSVLPWGIFLPIFLLSSILLYSSIELIGPVGPRPHCLRKIKLS